MVHQDQPGDGIRKIRTTSVFRAVNFELFVKPNKGIMAAGLIAMSACIAYLTLMNIQMRNRKVYKAVQDDGSVTLTERKSKWD
uniref:Small integral membrane protein 8 n=1 Tax=Strigamia maritima TaxID=126957 RepID=T1JP98_STRMM